MGKAPDGLILYERAKQALAELRRVDEVKSIRDKAVAMQAYAKQAKDFDLIEKATEICIRAERRAGEILTDMGERGERAKGGGDLRKELQPATLSSLGVTKTESSRWQALARLEEGAFELRVTAMKRQAVSPAALNKLDIRERRAEREAELAHFRPPYRRGAMASSMPIRRGVGRGGRTSPGSIRRPRASTRPCSSIRLPIPTKPACAGRSQRDPAGEGPARVGPSEPPDNECCGCVR